MECEDRDRRTQADLAGTLRERGEHDRGVGHHAVLVEVMFGAEKRVVAERFGNLTVIHDLLVQLRDGARELRIVIVDRE